MKISCSYVYLKCVKNGGSYVLGGHWRFLLENWSTGSSVMSYLTQGRYPKKIVFISLLKVCQKGAFVGVLGGYSGFLTADFDERFINYCHWWCHFTPRKISWKFYVHIFTKSVSRMGVPLWGYFEVIEGSWLDAWRTGSSFMSYITLLDPKDHFLKTSGCYLHVLWSYKWFWSKWTTSVLDERWNEREGTEIYSYLAL